MRIVGSAAVVFLFSTQLAWSAPFAANCRYDLDTPDSLRSDYDYISGQHYQTSVPGQHEHDLFRLDVNMDSGTVTRSDNRGGTGTWTNGRIWKTAEGGSAKDFVVTNGRFIWFGSDYFGGDGSTGPTTKYSLDLDSGLLNDPNGKQWQCQKAENRFQ